MRYLLATIYCVLPTAILAFPQLPKGCPKGTTIPKGAKGALPAKGDDGSTGGIFGMSGISLSSMANSGSSLLASGSESPKGMVTDNSGGSGKYNAHYVTDATLPTHTIYAPKTPPPADVKLPVIVWGNGGCMNNGAQFSNLLTEIASHGYIVLANGAPSGGSSSTPKAAKGSPKGAFSKGSERRDVEAMTATGSTVSQLTASIDWAVAGKGAKYGNIDASKIATAGQSCGGLESYSASYHDERVTTTTLFNSGLLSVDKTYLLAELRVPVAYFVGGPKDIAYLNAKRDYETGLPKALPATFASLDTGHVGTYFAKYGGKFGKAAVLYFDWVLKGDAASGAAFTDLDNSILVKEHWNVTSRAWK